MTYKVQIVPVLAGILSALLGAPHVLAQIPPLTPKALLQAQAPPVSAAFTVKGNLSRPLTGKVTVPSGSHTVLGSGTRFLDELEPGDLVAIGNFHSAVVSIASQEQLTLSTAHPAGALDSQAFTESDLLHLLSLDGFAWMVVDRAGRIGVGTSEPSAHLEVTGLVKAGAFVGDGSGLSNLPITSRTCGQLEYLRGFNANAQLLCECLPTVIRRNGACEMPVPGTFSYFVNPYGGCAGSGMDVKVERRFAFEDNTYEYRAIYKLRSDHLWQEEFTTTDWFRTSQRFEFAAGRDRPWFRVIPRGIDPPTFTRGDCKGGSTSRWGFLEWTLFDSDFQ